MANRLSLALVVFAEAPAAAVVMRSSAPTAAFLMWWRVMAVGCVDGLRGPMPAPSSLQARWFSYRTQIFYEIDLELPGTDALLEQWYRDYPPPDYRHVLVIGFSGEGKVFVSWWARCRACGRDRSQDFHAPIVESVYGEEVEGDPNRYRNRTQEYIDEGAMPSPW